MFDIKEIALMAAGESVRRFVREDDEVLAVKVQPRVALIRFKRFTPHGPKEFDLQVLHLEDGERYDLTPARGPVSML